MSRAFSLPCSRCSSYTHGIEFGNDVNPTVNNRVESSLASMSHLHRRAPVILLAAPREDETRRTRPLGLGASQMRPGTSSAIVEAERLLRSARHEQDLYIRQLTSMIRFQTFMYDLVERHHTGGLAINLRRPFGHSRDQMVVAAAAASEHGASAREELAELQRLVPTLRRVRDSRAPPLPQRQALQSAQGRSPAQRAQNIEREIGEFDARLKLQRHAQIWRDMELSALHTALEYARERSVPLTERHARDAEHWQFEAAERRWLSAQNGELFQTLGVNKFGLVHIFWKRGMTEGAVELGRPLCARYMHRCAGPLRVTMLHLALP